MNSNPHPGASAAGGSSTDARRVVWSLWAHVALMAASVHVVFTLLFAVIGLPVLLWLNVGSVLLHLGCRWLFTRNHELPAVTLMVSEVLLHAGAAVVALGWDSGFHYYVLTLILPLFMTIDAALRDKLAVVGLIGAYYGSLDAWMRGTVPYFGIDPATLDALRYFNLAGMLVIMVFVSMTYHRLVTDAESALRTLATTDPLTGLHNRRRMLEIARHAQSQTERCHRGVCVLLCDIDHFKKVNDLHGHDVGDRALRQVGSVLSGALREQDAVARWGGEEFLVLVVDADLDTAAQAAERIRRAVAGTAVAISPQASLSLTITIGVARRVDGESIDATIDRADVALYRGKNAGRDRVARAVESSRDAAVPAPAPASRLVGHTPDSIAA